MFDPLTSFDDAGSKRESEAETCAVSSQFIDNVRSLSLNFTNESLGLSHKAEVLIHLPHAVTLVVFLDRRVPLAGYLTQKRHFRRGCCISWHSEK